MFSFLKKVFDYLIFGNIYIGLAAAVLCMETQILAGFPLRLDIPVCLVFFCTVFIYNISRIRVFMDGSTVSSLLRLHPVYCLTVAGSFTGLISTLLFTGMQLYFILVPVGLLSVGYAIPIFKTKSNYVTLREISILKIFIISFVWGIATVGIPILHYNGNIQDINTWMMLVRRMLFVFAITIPFDIRDLVTDSEENLKTIPGLLGLKRSKALAYAAMAIFIILLFFYYDYSLKNWILGFHSDTLPLLLSAVVATYFIFASSQKRNRYYYLFILDGTMILQFLLVLVL